VRDPLGGALSRRTHAADVGTPGGAIEIAA